MGHRLPQEQLAGRYDDRFTVGNINIPYTQAIAREYVQDHTALRKFGYSSAVGATYEEVWDGAVAYTGWLTSATIVEVLSSDATDDDGAVGARTVQIYGLDANYSLQNETITLDGLNAVDSANQYIRVFRMVVRSAGTSEANVGTLTCRVDGGGATLAMIGPGNNQTLMAIWTVPANCEAYLTSFFAGSDVIGKATKVALFVRPFGEVFQVKKIILINGGNHKTVYDFPLKITEKSDIRISALAAGGGGEVAAGFDLWHEVD
jgi:hypothetical protein